MTSVLELDVSSAGTPGRYKVEVIQSPAGEASATFELDPAQLIDGLEGLQRTLLASSVPSRRLLSRGETSVRDVGRRLFDALLSQQAVAGVYRASSAVAAERGDALRIVLRMTAPELAVLPWESMFDSSADNYLARREPLVRYVPVPSSPSPLKVRLPLKILAPIASPRGLAPLDVEKEREDLTQALRPLVDRGAVVVQWLEHATWPALQDTLLSDSWHVVHFIGHGDFDIERDEGVLALETEQGRVHRVPAASFVDLLREAQPMPRLVVLNACESSTSGQTDLFSGTAAALVRGGVSAVVAMQFEISDQAAIAFSRGFYAAIGRARGVDEAVRSGRVAIVGLGEGSLEWITPTLYLRGRENHLFALWDSPSESAPETDVADQPGGAAAAAEDPHAATSVAQYDSVRAENPDDKAARPGRKSTVTAPRPAASAKVTATAASDDHTPPYPDRLAELLAVGKRSGWGRRPDPASLNPLRTTLPPDERIVGCIILYLTILPDDVAFWGGVQGVACTVTDQNVHLSTDTPRSRGWVKLGQQLPERYRAAKDWVRVPLENIDHPGEVVNMASLLAIRGGASLSLRKEWEPGVVQLVQQFITQAQDAARARGRR